MSERRDPRFPAARGDPALVSVITPCFNAAEFIAETLESVRSQSYPSIEHIVVDDGSTDSSPEIVLAHGNGVRLIRGGENRGAAAARNRGFAAARGEFLMFLDADDLISSDAIESLAAAVADREQSIAVCRWSVLGLQGHAWVELTPTIPFPLPPNPLAGWLEGIWVPPCAVLWRRDAYLESGGWFEDFNPNDDGDLMTRALLRGASLVIANGGRAYYRMHDASRLSLSTSGFMAGRLEAQLRAYERLEAEMRERGVFEQYSVSLGTAYRRLALRAYHFEDPRIGETCRRRADELGGRRTVSRTRPGRLLERVLGLERKEQIARWLSRFGIGTEKRMRHRRLRSENR